MPQKKKTQEPTPSLFDIPQWEEKKREFVGKYSVSIMNGNEKMAKIWNTYRDADTVVMPPLQIAPRICAYEDQMTQVIADYMRRAGMSSEDIEVIKKDYSCALWGGAQLLQASPKQMKAAVNAFIPAQAYLIDRWGLYSCLFTQYKYCLALLDEYTAKVTGPNATPQTQMEFWGAPFGVEQGTAMSWLLTKYVMKVEEMKTEDAASVYEFVNMVNLSCVANAFISLHYICKYAYNATDAELAEISIPERLPLDKRRLQTYAGKYAEAMLDVLTKAGPVLSNTIAGKEKEEDKGVVHNWMFGTYNRIEMPINVLAILTRAIEVSLSNDLTNKQFVMRRVKHFYDMEDEDGVKIHERFMPQKTDTRRQGGITEMSIQKTIEGVNLLPAYINGTKCDGSTTYRTTINKFAEICGYKGANQAIKMSLLGSLFLLNDLYVVYRKTEKPIKNKSGKPKKSGGITLTKILTVKELEPNSGKILIDVMDSKVKNRYFFVDKTKLLDVVKMTKSLPQSRFNYQIFYKSNIKVEDLINQIYGYDQQINDAYNESDIDTLKAIYREKEKRKTRHLEKITGWFENYKQRGIIESFEYNEKTGVFKWIKKNTTKIESDIAKPGELPPVEM